MRETTFGLAMGFVILTCIALTSATIVWLYNFTKPSSIGTSSSMATTVSDPGKSLFDAKCLLCHTWGAGKKIGPDLKGVTGRRDRAWITRFIKEPDKVIAEKDPIALKLLKEFNNVQMTPLGLSDAEVDTVVAFLAKQDGTPEKSGKPAAELTSIPSPSLSPLPVPKGNPQKGEEYFRGNLSFEKGGLACITCHNVQGVGLLGGGSLGPDLTLAARKFAGEGMFVWFEASPTMKPVFENHPVTEDERTDLLAFFERAGQIAAETTPQISIQEGPSQTGHILSVLFLGLVGGLVLVVLAGGIWWKRLKGVRKPLVLANKM